MQRFDDRPLTRRQLDQQPELMAGHFVDTASALGDELRVIVPDFDDRQPFVVVWMPLAGESGPVYPAAGDLAFVQEIQSDVFSGHVVTCWRPAS